MVLQIYKKSHIYVTTAREVVVICCVIEWLERLAARHSWASIAVNVCGIAVEVVGRALGHSVGQRVTLIYARLDTAQVDAAVVAVSRAVGE